MENYKKKKWKEKKKKNLFQRFEGWTEGVSFLLFWFLGFGFFSACTGSFKIKYFCGLLRVINLDQQLNILCRICSTEMLSG